MTATKDIHRTSRARRNDHARDVTDGTTPDFTSNRKLTTLNNPDPAKPCSYPRRVLLAVTGLSPQVVTETLYALAIKQDPPFIPTEIHLLTTAEGAERARLSLLHEKSGWFHRLCRGYNLKDIRFDSSNLHVLKDANGKLLNDIRSLADNECAADAITETVCRLTGGTDSALHVSIAGGRKTMGFYVGYALSLYGRPQDRLSHVLVNPPYESHPDFYYPTPDSHVIYTPGPDSRPLDTHNAEVTLAEIPFVRLRDSLSEDLLAGRASFSEAVVEAQKAIPPVELVLVPETRVVIAASESFTLKPAEFAFYWMLAERARRSLPGLHWSEPVADELLVYLAKLVNPNSGIYEKTEKAYKTGYKKENFDPAKAHVNKSIRNAMGIRRAQPYLITLQENIPGTRYRRSGLNLPSTAITVEQASLRVLTNCREPGDNCRLEKIDE